MTPQELITKAQELLQLASQIQADELFEDEPTRKGLTRELDELYHAWYREGLTLFARFNRLDLQQKFMREYEGNFVAPRIKHFLRYGWMIYRFYDPQKSDPLSAIKWTARYDRQFKNPVQNQCNFLAAL